MIIIESRCRQKENIGIGTSGWASKHSFFGEALEKRKVWLWGNKNGEDINILSWPRKHRAWMQPEFDLSH